MKKRRAFVNFGGKIIPVKNYKLRHDAICYECDSNCYGTVFDCQTCYTTLCEECLVSFGHPRDHIVTSIPSEVQRVDRYYSNFYPRCKQAYRLQYNMASFLENESDNSYNCDLQEEQDKLDWKIGYAWYGSPIDVNGYSEDQNSAIAKMRNKLITANLELRGNKKIQINFIFIVSIQKYMYNSTLVLVQHIPAGNYIEMTGREYASFEDFRANNKLPDSTIVYSLDGQYKGKETVIECQTNFRRSTFRSRVKVVDKISMVYMQYVLKKQSTNKQILLLVQIYFIGRVIYSMQDRWSHKEYWYPLNQTIFEFLQLTDRNGSTNWSDTRKYLTNDIIRTPISPGTHLMLKTELFGNIGPKLRSGGEPTDLQWLQFSASVFFHTNHVIDRTVVTSVITEARRGKFANARHMLSEEEEKQFIYMLHNIDIKLLTKHKPVHLPGTTISTVFYHEGYKPFHEQMCCKCSGVSFGKMFRCVFCCIEICHICYLELGHPEGHFLEELLPQLEMKSQKFSDVFAIAQKLQNEYGRIFKSSEKFNCDLTTDHEKLDRRIGELWYGSPNTAVTNCRYGYTETVENHLIAIRNIIINKVKKMTKSQTIRVNFVVVAYIENSSLGTLVLIKLLLKNAVHFIDPSGRTYTCFDDFLTNNQMQQYERTLLYPKNGIYIYSIGYQTETEIRKISGPNLIKQPFLFLDKCATYDGLSVAIGAIASLFAPTIAEPIFKFSQFLRGYASLRAAYWLHDLYCHEQIASPEAFTSFLTICGTRTERINLTHGLKKLAVTTAHLPHGSFSRLIWNSAKIAGIVYQVADEIFFLELLRIPAESYNFFHAIDNFESAEQILTKEQRIQIAEEIKMQPAEQQINMESYIHDVIEKTDCMIQGIALALKQNRSDYPDEVQSANQSDIAKKHTNILGHTVLYNHAGKWITFPTDESAIKSADQAVGVRFGGNMKKYPVQLTTVLSIPSTAFDDLIELNLLAGNVDASDPELIILPGRMYATKVKSIKMKNIKTHTVVGHYVLDGIRVKLKNGKGWHLDLSNSTKQEVIIDAQNIVSLRATNDELDEQPLCIDGSPFHRLLHIKHHNVLQMEKYIQKR